MKLEQIPDQLDERLHLKYCTGFLGRPAYRVLEREIEKRNTYEILIKPIRDEIRKDGYE